MDYSTILLFSFLLSAAAAADPCADPTRHSGANDISIFHSSSKCFSPTTPPPADRLESVLASAAKDPARLAYLSSLVASARGATTTVPVAAGQNLMQTYNYVLRAALGTPGQPLLLALDTGADSAWVPCAGCSGCPSSTSLFSPASSSTYRAVDCGSGWCPRFKGPACAEAGSGGPCAYNATYGGDSAYAGTVSQDTLMLGRDAVADYAFGCVGSVTGGSSMPKQGLLGLGRGSNGLMAQATSLYQGVFSYCLPSFRSYYFSGSLRLGPVGQPKAIRTTPLLLNPHRPSLYYVNLTGVSVGRVLVPVPPGSFDFDPRTGAGTVVDSGTVVTRLVAPAYAAVRDEFRRQVNASGGYSSLGAFDTCFSAGPATAIPAVTLHMEGLDVALPAENAMIHSSATLLACLAVGPAPENVNAVVNVIANYQQQNYRVLVDAVNSKVGFAREVCN